ncbi:MAG TPA: type II toxin-antitoxin system VapC family toxin [Rhizomicrobium sp.]|jgi:predicted nucleic-acid-binding protein|nr:type II toxin-antitoxin system VapC family toxin [Rhizomicrobium sp.]
MLAVDTNIVVRYLTTDDPAQAKRARNLVDGNPIFLPTTVLLESEWVLRSYRLTREQVLAQLRDFLRLATVTAENPLRVSRALAWAEAGMDFADALHLAAAEDCEAFITFDQPLVKAARSHGLAVRAP